MRKIKQSDEYERRKWKWKWNQEFVSLVKHRITARKTIVQGQSRETVSLIHFRASEHLNVKRKNLQDVSKSICLTYHSFVIWVSCSICFHRLLFLLVLNKVRRQYSELCCWDEFDDRDEDTIFFSWSTGNNCLVKPRERHTQLQGQHKLRLKE